MLSLIVKQLYLFIKIISLFCIFDPFPKFLMLTFLADHHVGILKKILP